METHRLFEHKQQIKIFKKKNILTCILDGLEPNIQEHKDNEDETTLKKIKYKRKSTRNRDIKVETAAKTQQINHHVRTKTKSKFTSDITLQVKKMVQMKFMFRVFVCV